MFVMKNKTESEIMQLNELWICDSCSQEIENNHKVVGKIYIFVYVLKALMGL